MNRKQLSEVLAKHGKWAVGSEGGERADLRGADLFGADLGDADLGGADLRGADLRGADLRGANLGGAYRDIPVTFDEVRTVIWHESHDNLTGLAEWLHSECSAFKDIGDCLYFFSKPWKWEREYEIWQLRQMTSSPESIEACSVGCMEAKTAKDIAPQMDHYPEAFHAQHETFWIRSNGVAVLKVLGDDPRQEAEHFAASHRGPVDVILVRRDCTLPSKINPENPVVYTVER